MRYFLIALLVIGCSQESVQENSLKRYLAKKITHQSVLSFEGQYINVFNPKMIPYVKEKLSSNKLEKLSKLLAPALEIGLTPTNFTKAAERLLDGDKDETNYDAVWVRDSAWIYFALKKSNQNEKAKKLVGALWSYYASSAQIDRIEQIIKDPTLAKDSKMNVPHIRFNGSSKTFDDVIENEKPQLWNHRQNDAHGLFLLALGDAISSGLISEEELVGSKAKVLTLFPTYFDKINYHEFKGAGAWEEIDKVNTSSIAMVVKAFENYDSNIIKKLSWDTKLITKLISNGYKTIRRQLYLGGEATQSGPYTPEFRMEDAALFNLFLPMPLKELDAIELRYALTIIEKLIRPFGVIRYHNDSYQAGNYWIKPQDDDQPELTGDASSNDLFLKRFEKLIPNTEAQWFFDSKISMIYSQMLKRTKDETLKKQARYKAIYHFKRAIGQITGSYSGSKILAADGKEVRDLQVPESINTVILQGKRYYLASPITPLNWAKASLLMSKLDLEELLQ